MFLSMNEAKTEDGGTGQGQIVSNTSHLEVCRYLWKCPTGCQALSCALQILSQGGDTE